MNEPTDKFNWRDAGQPRREPKENEPTVSTLLAERAVNTVLISRLLEATEESIDALGECDHDTGICFCGLHMLANDARAVLGLPELNYAARGWQHTRHRFLTSGQPSTPAQTDFAKRNQRETKGGGGA